MNNDAVIDISDAIYLLSWLITGGPEAPAPAQPEHLVESILMPQGALGTSDARHMEPLSRSPLDN
jgi:hypothetical protein